jgi:hypothetical protein
MNVLNFIIANWDFILLIVAAVVAVVFAIFKGNKSVVMHMLYALVTDAETQLGAGTGSLKLATVIDLIYPKLPGIIKTFISNDTLVRWVEEALAKAKEAWAKNPALLEAYAEKPAQAAQNDAQSVGEAIAE